MSRIQLTPQQQDIVAHTYGPAVVFAVAGSGKTTALEHRIARLVREGIFQPQRILVAAYNVAVKEELQQRLQNHPGCEAVQVMTIHSLGLRAIHMAFRQGKLDWLAAGAFKQFEKAQDTVLNATLVAAKSQKVPYEKELDTLDRKDFFTHVTKWKGNLFYPNLHELPDAVRATGLPRAVKPPSHNPWYAQLYGLFETVRRQKGLLTFDDQILLGWELLVSYPSIRQQLQRSFDCVLVDEFQDVNRAQYEILDMVAAPHKNYMVVGDDDQTIYQWRGADPDFILQFDRRYNARRYFMTDNFRCRVGPLVLANEVIRHNKKRVAKALRLTKGLDGEVEIIRSSDETAMGWDIVERVQTSLRRAYRLDEIAVLVRVYSQTPPVEQALIATKIPYVVANGKPFFSRWEVETLVCYCRLAWLDKQLRAGNKRLLADTASLAEWWQEVYRHPKRYISRDIAEQLLSQALTRGVAMTQVLDEVEVDDKPWLKDRLRSLAEILRWLGTAFSPGEMAQRPAVEVLTELNKRLGYTNYLEQRSSDSEAGVDEAENVRQFIQYARGRGTLDEYLRHIKELKEQQQRQAEAAQGEVLTIRSIHSAKGLEWPVVILPSCDDGILPHRKSANLEEERRLLYVALTRSKRDLFIYHLKPDPSPFLQQAKATRILQELRLIRNAVVKDPKTWSPAELKALAIRAYVYGLLDYLRDWHPWTPAERDRVVHAMLEVFRQLGALNLTIKLSTLLKIARAWRQVGTSIHVSVTPQVGGLEYWLEKLAPKPKGATSINPKKTPSLQKPQTTPSSAKVQAQPLQIPAQKAVPPLPPTKWYPGRSVLHAKRGKGVVLRTQVVDNQLWLVVKFWTGTVGLRADNPLLEPL